RARRRPAVGVVGPDADVPLGGAGVAEREVSARRSAGPVVDLLDQVDHRTVVAAERRPERTSVVVTLVEVLAGALRGERGERAGGVEARSPVPAAVAPGARARGAGRASCCGALPTGLTFEVCRGAGAPGARAGVEAAVGDDAGGALPGDRVALQIGRTI